MEEGSDRCNVLFIFIGKGKKECPTLRPLQLEALWGEIGMLETVGGGGLEGKGEGVCKLEKMVTGVCAVNFVCGEKHES